MGEQKQIWTPGPWKVRSFRDTPVICADMEREVVGQDTEPLIAHVDYQDPFTTANAHLLAAAPELYEALAVLVAVTEHPSPTIHARAQAIRGARGALSKARGEQS